MISRTRLSYTAGVAFLAFLIGVTLPAFATSLSSFNSHSLSVNQLPGSPGYKDHEGPGYLIFWTKNATLAANLPLPTRTVTGTVTIKNVNGTVYNYDCYGPDIVDTEPAGTTHPQLGGNFSFPFTTPPAPGYSLVIIDLSHYCKLTGVVNG